MLAITILLLATLSIAQFPPDLSQVIPDLSDPKDAPLYPVGVLNDVYIHFNLDPTTLDLDTIGGDETKAFEILLGLTDVWNRASFNPVNINLVASGFSIAARDTGGEYLHLEQYFNEGETHIVVHMSDIVIASQAIGGGLYDGRMRSHAMAATWNARFTHGDRISGAHEIGHLFGMPHSHSASINWPNEIEVDIDYCGGSPRGVKECFTKPYYGGTCMSYCHECPVETSQGQLPAFYGAKALTSFHPFIGMKIQERYDAMKHNLATIEYPNKLRSFIPDSASRNRCAREGQTCQCNGVVYFGPSVSSTSTKIFAVVQNSGSVRCSSGASEAFPDVFHGKSKSCYCDEDATVGNVSYLPTEVDFMDAGSGECQFTCRNRHDCRWNFDTGYFDIEDQPDWKCKQECLDRDNCEAYNVKNGKCRLYQRPPVSVSNSGYFTGSTCWMRPQNNIARDQQPQHQILNGVEPVVGVWGSWGSWSQCSAECGSGTQTRTRVCNGSANCVGSNIETRNCNVECTPTWGPWSQWSACSASCGSGIQTKTRSCNGNGCVGSSTENRPCTEEACETQGCTFVEVEEADCPSDLQVMSVMKECNEPMSPGELCEADVPLPDGNSLFNVNNCPGSYDVFRYECSDTVSTTCEFIPIPERDCPSVTEASRMHDCHEGMFPGELCESDGVLPNGQDGNALDNCSGYDVFRYVCSDTSPPPSPEWASWGVWSSCSAVCGPGTRTRTRDCIGNGCVGEASEHQTCNNGPCDDTATFQLVGSGYCRTSSNSGVDGMVTFSKTDAECRQACDLRNDCIGYASMNSGRGTCYVYGPYHVNKPADWYGVSGYGTDIGMGSGNVSTMNCYKLA